MFLSGESFLEQTRFYLGLSDDPPETFVLMGPSSSDPEARRPIAHGMEVATHLDGLVSSPQVPSILGDRARHASRRPAEESVLVVAHGMGNETSNERVLAAMGVAAQTLVPMGFARVEVATLREDWAVPRERSEAAIREFVRMESSAGRTTLVLPMRLSGFGPYAEVLAELTYEPTEGLLPHPAVTTWLEVTADRVTCGAGWGPVIDTCDPVIANTPLLPHPE